MTCTSTGIPHFIIVHFITVHRYFIATLSQQRSSASFVQWYMLSSGLPWWLIGKDSFGPYGRHEFNPWVRKIPWRRKWQCTPVLLPGKSHGQRSLAGYSLWGYKQSDTTERLTHTDTRLNRWDHLLNEKFGFFFHIMCKYVLVAVMLLKL